MADVFISYANPDRSFAFDLADELRSRGFSVWIDQMSIRGAKNWVSEIVSAINDCHAVLCLLSTSSVASENVAREIHLASEKKKHILPVMLEQVILPPKLEYPLAGLQRVQYHDSPAIFQALESLGAVVATEVLPEPAFPADDSIRIAVLPFDDLSPQHDNQWFADGMMDELISTLGSLEHVKVPPRSDVLHYRDHKKKSREIAREMGVRYLIEGGVRKAKDKIRINASLTDTSLGEQLWANKFDGSFDDVFEFQESVSRQITESLRLQLSSKAAAKIEQRPTRNVGAYELYLRAREKQYLVTRDGYEEALRLYEEAARIDPNYADAYIGIASACNAYYRECSRNPKWLERSLESAKRAEAITGETAKTLWIRGEVEWLRGNNEKAIKILLQSVQVDPLFRNSVNSLATLYMNSANYREAVRFFKVALGIDENPTAFFNLLVALLMASELQILKESAITAIPLFERYFLRQPDDHNARLQFAFVLLWAGNKNASLKIANDLFTRKDLTSYSLYNLGCLFDSLGKPELFISLFERAIENGYREIEQTRNYVFSTKNEECEGKFRELLQTLEATIGHEAKQTEAVWNN